MRSVFAAAAGLLIITAAPSLAQQPPAHPAPAPGHAMQPGQAMAPQTRPAPTPPTARPPAARPQTMPGHMESGPRPYQAEAGMMHGEMNYGRWESGWGARPPAPPRHFTRHEDWYRHVRACQQRYRSYNPRTDMYVPRHGHTARCTL